ncbi:MAG: DNA repair protein RecN [Clostridiales bacterium]|nr:DNA repair protein RecN [Clostridiales bacterium]
MLISLEIKNFAVISEAVFEPGRGLNVITGETGAGKSLLVDALGLIMGDKASKNLIRSERDHAYVEAVFDIADLSEPSFHRFLEENDIIPEEDRIIISRKISQDGKSIAKINGKTVVLSVLRQLSAFLIDIHGQNDTQILFDENKNCDLLFSFGGTEVKLLKDAYDAALTAYKEKIVRIRELSGSPDALRQRKEYLEYAVAEIDEAGLKEGIEEELLSAKRRIARSCQISEALASLNSSLDDNGAGRGIITSLSSDLALMDRSSGDDEQLKELASRLESVILDLQALKDDASSMLDDLDFDPAYKEQVDQKIGRIFDLKSKYGSDVTEILEFRDKSVQEIGSFDDVREELARLKSERRICEQTLIDAAGALSDALREKAVDLEKDICRELADLEMPESLFKVEFTERSKDRYFSSHGIYDIRFMFSANPGQGLKPLSAIVSGGEASRIMLAIRNILSCYDSISTLVFDEIDMGVSGKASSAIAYKLRSIGNSHQVLCVSHTSQICAAANNNFLLSKKIDSGNTTAVVTALDQELKVNEVARLLSGKNDDSSVDLAKNLIEQFSV